MLADSHKKKNSAASIAGLSLHAFGDSAAIAKRARAGLDAKFVRQAKEIDPSLRGQALDRKVQLLKTLHFKKLGLMSAKARSRKRKRRGH